MSKSHTQILQYLNFHQKNIQISSKNVLPRNTFNRQEKIPAQLQYRHTCEYSIIEGPLHIFSFQDTWLPDFDVSHNGYY